MTNKDSIGASIRQRHTGSDSSLLCVHIVIMHAHVCVCVCVYVRTRKRPHEFFFSPIA